LVASNNLDCKDTVTHCLPAFNDTSSIIYVPNVFSPNADGINDVFKIYSRNIELQQFVIFDRWGNNVFETKNINQAWDGFRNGKKCDVGTYFYYIKYKTLFGVEKTLQGDVSLVK
jgi:gliding motility-associated-like protein